MPSREFTRARRDGATVLIFGPLLGAPVRSTAQEGLELRRDGIAEQLAQRRGDGLRVRAGAAAGAFLPDQASLSVGALRAGDALHAAAVRCPAAPRAAFAAGPTATALAAASADGACVHQSREVGELGGRHDGDGAAAPARAARTAVAAIAAVSAGTTG